MCLFLFINHGRRLPVCILLDESETFLWVMTMRCAVQFWCPAGVALSFGLRSKARHLSDQSKNQEASMQASLRQISFRDRFLAHRSHLLRFKTGRKPSGQRNRAYEYELFISLKSNLEYLRKCFEDLDQHWDFMAFEARNEKKGYDIKWIQRQIPKVAVVLERVSLTGGLHSFLQKAVDEALQADLTGTTDFQHTFVNTRVVLKTFFYLTHFLRLAIYFAENLSIPPEQPDFDWSSLLFVCSGQ